jgi:hypothetical protein
MSGSVADGGDDLGEGYRGWPPMAAAWLVAFDAQLDGVPPAAAIVARVGRLAERLSLACGSAGLQQSFRRSGP